MKISGGLQLNILDQRGWADIVCKNLLLKPLFLRVHVLKY